MKLLNFSNLEFKREEEKRIRFYAYFIDFRYKFKFKYGFYHPISLYFRIKPKIKWCKTDYQKYFINIFKLLKRNIANETS